MLLYPSIGKKKTLSEPKYGRNREKDFASFINFCNYFSNKIDIDLLRKAFIWCVRAHSLESRKSGDPYYTHPLEVATIVVKNIAYDDTMVCSALLHDVLGNNAETTVDDIRSEFGETIAKIVESISRITYLERQIINRDEYYRLLLLSLFTDVRIIMVKIADRLHDMRNISYLEPDLQREIADDTMQIYCPFAHRFGLGAIKSELEDLSFKVLDKKNYDLVVRKLKLSRYEQERYLLLFTEPIIKKLEHTFISLKSKTEFEVYGRVKHIYSIYNKTLLRQKEIEELYDLIAVRIILKTDDFHLCYKAFEEIRSIYEVVEGTYKDYIKNPKPNGYQSIHCAFWGPYGQKVEVQIRTQRMHEIAEKGIAAHYNYKRGLLPANSVLEDQKILSWMNEVRQLLSRVEEVPLEKLLEGFSSGILTDEIYVLTPANEIKVLPKGATGLDFAYYIHTEIGNRCVGIKVNGRPKPLSFALSNGDRVEVITSPKGAPDIEWLKFVRTNKAISSITKYFKARRKQILQGGRDLFDNMLTKYQISNKVKILDVLTKISGYTNSEDLYYNLFLDMELQNAVEQFFQNVASKVPIKSNNYTELLKVAPLLRNYHREKSKEILANPSNEILFATCCYPVRGEESVGIYNGDSVPNPVYIHRSNCVELSKISNKTKCYLVEVDWGLVHTKNFVVGLTIAGGPKVEIIDRLIQLLNQFKDLVIDEINIERDDEEFAMNVFFRVKDKDGLSMAVKFLKDIPQIHRIQRIGGANENY